ncbi:hypothetical protein EDD21DRAFT_449521 [Dissophora ornata]|nr:hypothetical protein EDD21DRAFT_449521 [Dissophora ornata]
MVFSTSSNRSCGILTGFGRLYYVGCCSLPSLFISCASKTYFQANRSPTRELFSPLLLKFL